MPRRMHTTGQPGRYHVPPTSEQSGLIIMIGGSVLSTETSSDGTQTAERINSACADDLGYCSKVFDSNFLSFLPTILSFPCFVPSTSISFVLKPFLSIVPISLYFFFLLRSFLLHNLQPSLLLTMCFFISLSSFFPILCLFQRDVFTLSTV
jgi:hypothetical protein